MARQQAPGSIRALLGTDTVHKVAHGSSSPASAAEELAFFFGSSGISTNATNSSRNSTGSYVQSSWGPGASGSGACSRSAAQVRSCCRCCGTTLGVILPSAVKDGIAGLMLEEIQAAFQVTGLQLFNLSKHAAAEFQEVSRHRG